MPGRRKVPLPFGQGMVRDVGSMAVRPTQMEDLRNVYFRRGKLVVRKGLEQRLLFQDSAGNNCTHVLAGQAISSERSAIAVAYEQDNTGEVNVYRLDADATVAQRIGTWFTLSTGSEPPIVVAAESRGRVFLAHDELRASQREATVVYDPLRGSSLETLEADLDGNGTAPIAFRGVVRHLAYIFGWGFGSASEDRPEFVRSSLPGEPTLYEPEHYWMVGDRRDPVVTVKRAGRTAMVFKEGETHEISGSGRDNFGQEPLDTLHGVLAPRLAVTVGDSVYGWSAEGPRRWRSGTEGSQDLAIPLELDGFEPSDLAARGDLREGFAHYVPAERVVVFVFGQRVYAVSIRNPQQPEWTYWEWGVTPFCAFTVPSLGAGIGAETQDAPTGHPEFLNNIAPRNNDELRPKWKNVGQDGDEFVNIWTRELVNLAQDWRLDLEGSTAGVAAGWSETDDANLTTAFSIDQEAQKISVSASSGAGFSYIERQDITRDPIVAGEDYGISVALQVANLVATGKARLVYRWFDDVDAQIGADQVVDDAVAPAEFQRSIDVEATAPAGAVRLDVLVGFRADAGGDTGNVWFRDVSVDPVADRGTWVEYGSFLVATTAEQDQRLDGFESGTFHEIALRYTRSVFVTAGYEGSDPDTWPLESRGAGSTPLASASLENSYWWYGETSLGSEGHGLGFEISYEPGVKEAIQEAITAGKSAGIEVWRKRPGGTKNETEFTLLETVEGAPDAYEDDALGDETADETEEDYEYKIRTFVSNQLSGFSDPVVVWPGPFDEPTGLTAFQHDDSGDGTDDSVKIVWTNSTTPHQITFEEWCQAEKQGETQYGNFGPEVDTHLWRENVTDAVAYAKSSTQDCTDESDVDGSVAGTQGDTLNYKARHYLRIAGEEFYSPFSNEDQVVMP